jgi:hypothetical protein
MATCPNVERFRLAARRYDLCMRALQLGSAPVSEKRPTLCGTGHPLTLHYRLSGSLQCL